MNTIIDKPKYLSILSKITRPSDVMELSGEELQDLVWACRQRIIDATSVAGGHLASSLGTVELTAAMFKVFNAEQDCIVWDVGHQAYTHKILTGRSEQISRIGTRAGVAKFLRREESPYDHFGAGHASTSVSAGVGMAMAAKLHGTKRNVACIIGDGAMTGGMAFEGMNHIGHLDLDIKVIFNDNNMSIDPNVGALSKAFNMIQSNQMYNKIRNEVASFKDYHSKIPRFLYDSLRRVDHSFMEFLSPATWFEKLGFRYFGPIDGHNVEELVEMLENVKAITGPVLVHVITHKGKGYEYAEKDSLGYHGVTPFEPASGKFLKSSSSGESYTAIWSRAFTEVMDKDPAVVGISAAMIGSTGLKKLEEKYPDRIFDVGIAEQHAVTFAGGLATQGVKPFVAIYSTFLQRAFDQIIHDICLQNLPVRFALDRAGYVGADGATHHGAFDLSYLRLIPNMVIMAPKDGDELVRMVRTAHSYDKGPIAFRFPRGNAPGKTSEVISDEPLEIGKSELIKEGSDIAIFAIGSAVNYCEDILDELAAKGINAALYNARFVKPLDSDALKDAATRYKGIVTVEENAVAGGFGAGVLEELQRLGLYVPVKLLGMPDKFIEYGTPDEQKTDAGLDRSSLISSVVELYNTISTRHRPD